MARLLPPGGTFGEWDLAAILFQVQQQAIEGELRISSPACGRSIFIEDQKVQFASSTRPEDWLGNYLLQHGVISADLLQKASQLVQERKIRLGRALLEMGIFNSDYLWTYVQAHLRWLVVSLFTLSEGRFELLPAPEKQPENIRLESDILSLILEGTRQIEDRQFIERQLQPIREFFPARTEAANRLPLKAHEFHLLHLARTRHTLQDIMQRSELLAFETQRILYSLLRLGILADRPEPVAARTDRAQKSWLPSFTSFDEALSYFNGKFEYVYRLLSKEIGPVSFSILSQAVGEIQERLPGYFQQIQLNENGSLDKKTILKSVWYVDFEENITDFLRALEEILYSEIFAVKKHLGKEYEQTILQWIREPGV